MKPIYKPKGAAGEYGEYALNIYSGCPHSCFYCYVPSVLHKDRSKFHSVIEPRKNIVEETRKQLEREKLTGKTIHLCFTCDPYPTGCDTSTTREIIKLLKEYGNHVQILTKSIECKDFDLLDSNDWFGITVDGMKEADLYYSNFNLLSYVRQLGIKTWVSFEPVIVPENVYDCIAKYHSLIDMAKIGKLNYHKSNVDWNLFGHNVEALCKELGVNYYIKDSLRKEMQ